MASTAELLLFLLIVGVQVHDSRCDDLMSARCQSRCLHELTVRHQDNAELRRTLRHQIFAICSDDKTCSACTLACHSGLTEAEKCGRAICASSADVASCERSCDFLHEFFSEKPGACPAARHVSNYECLAECRLDGDCAETSKCCSWGCSRKCIPAEMKPAKSGVPGTPFKVTVQERKRKRSAVVRWELGASGRDLADIYVLEWRWGLHPHALTPWQTLATKHKEYAILKHLLSPGRFYEFRVAAVNRFGTNGFSEASQPFKLSKEAQAPGPPRNLRLGDAKLHNGFWSQTVQWTAPSSDLPINSYQVSWASSTEREAATYEELMRRLAIIDSDKHEKRDADDDELTLVQKDRTTVLVPAHSTQTTLEQLKPNAVYIVEIHATADSSDGILNGEKAIIFARTAIDDSSSDEEYTDLPSEQKQLLQVPTNNPPPDHLNGLQVENPHFVDSLTAPINWLNSQICSPQRRVFTVEYTAISCDGANKSSAGIRNVKTTSDCFLKLQNLAFGCIYKVSVGFSDADKPSIIGSFATRSCEETPTAGKPPCDEAEISDLQLRCTWLETSIECNWNRQKANARETTIGYRVVLSSRLSDGNSISILPPQTTSTRFDNLPKNENYVVELQPITNRGVGQLQKVDLFASEFTSPTDISQELIADDVRSENLLEILEMPLESSSKSHFSIISLIVLLLLRQ